MTISERIFALLDERRMTQKEFSQKTGIAQSSISDWKRKKTNPVADKILIICEVLDVTPYELLSGAEGHGNRSNPSRCYVIDKDSQLGELIGIYQSLKPSDQGRLLGYVEAVRAEKR